MPAILSTFCPTAKRDRRRCPLAPLLGLALALGVVGAPSVRAAAALSLEDAVREALDAHPSARVALRRAEAARAALDEARAAGYPRLSVSAGYYLTDHPPQTFMMELSQRRLDMRDPNFDPNRVDDTGNLNLSIGAHYLLYDGGARARMTSMAEKSAELAEWHDRAARDDLAFEVIRAWYGALHARAVLTVREATRDSIKALLETARERLAAGTVVPTDVLNIDVRLAEAREQVIRARNGRSLAIAALNTAIGRETLNDEIVPDEFIPPAPPDFTEPDADAYRAHPAWHAAVVSEGIAHDAFQASRSRRAPRLHAFGKTDWDSEHADRFESSYAVGITAELDVFTGFEHGAAIRRTRAEWHAAEAAMTDADRRLRLRWRRALIARDDAWERIDVTESGVAGATEALRMTRERYVEGAADVTELLMAQMAETAARTRAVTALFDYCVAVADLQHAQGRLAERFMIKPEIHGRRTE